MGLTTVKQGAVEIDQGPEVTGRVRRPGAGRPKAPAQDPELMAALDALVEPDARGDPMSPLRWTAKSTRTLADELTRQRHRVSASTVAGLLTGLGYSLQATSKQVEGAQHPDRDGQFRYLNEQASSHLADGQPVISVDTRRRKSWATWPTPVASGSPRVPGPGRRARLPRPKVGKAIPVRGLRPWPGCRLGDGR
jgi:hypothetical protein